MVYAEVTVADLWVENGFLVYVTVMQQTVGQELPTIIVTANNTEDVRRLTEQRGHLFMAKPVKPARLRALISSLLTL